MCSLGESEFPGGCLRESIHTTLRIVDVHFSKLGSARMPRSILLADVEIALWTGMAKVQRILES